MERVILTQQGKHTKSIESMSQFLHNFDTSAFKTMFRQLHGNFGYNVPFQFNNVSVEK